MLTVCVCDNPIYSPFHVLTASHSLWFQDNIYYPQTRVLNTQTERSMTLPYLLPTKGWQCIHVYVFQHNTPSPGVDDTGPRYVVIRQMFQTLSLPSNLMVWQISLLILIILQTNLYKIWAFFFCYKLHHFRKFFRITSSTWLTKK